MFLPTCSREVHSAEHLWLLTHEALAKMHFETLSDLDGALAQRCRILANDPDQKAVHHLHRDGQDFIYLATILSWNSRSVLTLRVMPPVLARTNRRVQPAYTPAIKTMLTIMPQCFRSLPVETCDGRLD